jgi:hypothetical protein
VTESGWLGLVELLLVLGGVLAFGVWELISLRRDRNRVRQPAAGESSGDDRDRLTD